MTTAEAIQTFADEIAQTFRPEKIILFGSYADGEPNRDSDVDLLVVMAQEGRPSRLAAAIRQQIASPFPVDLLVRSPETLKERIALNHFFSPRNHRKGKSPVCKP